MPASSAQRHGEGHQQRTEQQGDREGPLVIGDNSKIGDTSALRDSIIFPGTELAAGTILIDAIAGHVGIAESLREL